MFSSNFVINNVLYIAYFSINLIPVSQLCKQSKYKVNFTYDNCFIQDPTIRQMISLVDSFEGLYHLILKDKHGDAHATYYSSTCNLPDIALWNFRLRHISPSKMQSIHAIFPFIVLDKNVACDVCHYAKHKRNPYHSSFNKSKQPFELIHFDIWGPIAVKSHHDHSYICTTVDDFSRYTWIILMKAKSETRQNVINFIKVIETQHNSKPKIIRSDNGSEFIMPRFYASKGISHQTSCDESP